MWSAVQCRIEGPEINSGVELFFPVNEGNEVHFLTHSLSAYVL